MNQLLVALILLSLPALAAPIPTGIVVDSKAKRLGFDIPAQVLAKELQDRTGAIWSITGGAAGVHFLRDRKLAPEAFRITQSTGTLTIAAADKLGALFAVGHLLRHLRVEGATADYLAGDHTETPAFPLRGHQLGYRAAANSYDAWEPEQFERYILDLAFFGTNMIEGIPFQDERPLVNTKTSRRDMNRKLSEICAKYGLQYWVWTPADFDLKDRAKCDEQLAQYDQLYTDCVELSGVFFPGGDPGDNPPDLVLPYLAEVAQRLAKHHPKAKIWVSLQGFSPTQNIFVYDWIKKNEPAWLGGLVAGPSAPPMQGMRRQLAPQYGLRDYQDITHTVRCQNPIPWWDPAYGLTLGRECINARPLFYANVFRFFAPFANTGFGTYSDGVHDDVNKILLSRLGCAPESSVRDILAEYARLFWGDAHATEIADGLLAFEKDWDGPLADNATVEGTLKTWHDLESKVPALATTWRGQMFLTLAEYDAYTRRRLLAETAQEASFNTTALHHSGALDDASLDALFTLLQPAPDAALQASIAARYESLYHLIGLQSSFEKYQASGRERGCSLDTLDYPLNNRWWIEDEFKKIRALPIPERPAALRRIASWEDPGPGGYYDALGHPGRAPHVVRSLEVTVEPDLERAIVPTQWWWDNGLSRRRLTWQTSMDWPAALRYDGLDPKAHYTLRIVGFGTALPVADGDALAPTLSGKEIGEPKEFPVTPKATADGRLEITFHRPAGEAGLNWREQSRGSEVWLLKDQK